MKLYGKIVKGTNLVKEAMVERYNDTITFRDLLEECFIELCRELDVPVPLWLKKNTNEFVAYRRTFFTEEQFVDKVGFNRLEIRLEA